MNMPTPQQELFYRRLAAKCDLKVVYSTETSPLRKRLGWDIRPSGYEFEFQHELSFFERYKLTDRDFHFLSGLPGEVANVCRILFASEDQRTGVQAEMRIPEIQTRRRHLQSIAYAKLLRARGGTFFAIGKPMREYYQRIDVPLERTFPFAYFCTERSSYAAAFEGPILFVGELSYRKGVDTLVRAFARSKVATKRKLCIAGDGSARDALMSLSKQNGVERSVEFIGAIPQSMVSLLMRDSSVLVLPSRHDGWGCVVNEALSVGLPVVVSDRCGVAEVIEANGGGLLFPSEDGEYLANVLDEVLASREKWKTFSHAARRAHDLISAESGAEYFLDIVKYVLSNYKGPRPIAPWLAQS